VNRRRRGHRNFWRYEARALKRLLVNNRLKLLGLDGMVLLLLLYYLLQELMLSLLVVVVAVSGLL
jgi:hypothetical protein